jgi:hypothetical protein
MPGVTVTVLNLNTGAAKEQKTSTRRMNLIREFLPEEVDPNQCSDCVRGLGDGAGNQSA